jgi:hypothetical protein
MPSRLYIPRQVIEAISSYIDAAIDQAQKEFWSANEDEDTLTGHLFARLKTGVHLVDVTQDEINGPWKWSIDYTKFRGRGKDAAESFLGADGIIELYLDRGYRHESKGLLFQSKVDWTSNRDLLEQAILLSTWREASIVINYTAAGFDAYPIDSILASKGVERNTKNKLPLKEALTKYFLECRVGSTDLSYDARARRLVWRDTNGVLVATQFRLSHRVRIEVQAPAFKPKFNFDKLIKPNEIHHHRMDVHPEDVLTPMLTNEREPAKAVKRALSLAYHPDRYASLNQLFRDLMNRRMQEVNAASDELLKRERK